MLKAYKYRIYPNREQQVLIEKHFGCSRFVFNWALALQKRYYSMFGTSLSRTKIQNQLVKKKKTAKYAWLNEVNSQTLLSALLHVHTAFINFFKGRAKFPRFKSKKTHSVAIKTHNTARSTSTKVLSTYLKLKVLRRYLAVNLSVK